LIAVLDAGRDEVYAGEYEVRGNASSPVSERLLTKAEAFARAREAILVTSDKMLAEAANAAGLALSLVAPIDAGTIASLGWRKIKTGKTVSPEDLEANYMRRSDAEIFGNVSKTLTTDR
jgi:tRNA threonylcarbamoyladenosine biosynthesis protein TsaB